MRKPNKTDHADQNEMPLEPPAQEEISSPDATNPVVTLKDGRATASSLDVAGHFGKRHDNVLRTYDGLECSPDFNRLNFEAVEYVDSKGERRRSVSMTKDGCVFLASRFTGKKAARFLESYIAEFNRMENELRALSGPHGIDGAAIAKLSASAAGGAAKGAVTNQMAAIEHRFDDRISGVNNRVLDMAKKVDKLHERMTKQAKWEQERNREQWGILSKMTDSSMMERVEDHIEVGEVYEIAGVDLKGRVPARGLLTRNITIALEWHCLEKKVMPGIRARMGQRYKTFPRKIVTDWLIAEGHDLISRHMRKPGTVVVLHEVKKSDDSK